jgi:magnesium transporter
MSQSKKHHSRSEKVGLPPGSLLLLGEETMHPNIDLYQFTPELATHRSYANISEVEILSDQVNWIHISGLNTSIIEQIGAKFSLHNLVLEDILSTGQRPKVDEFDDYIYFVLRLVNFVGAELVSEQVSFILGKNYVLSIAEKRSDFSAPIIDRIINKKGAVRSNKSDYLLYALIDVVVDNFYFSMDSIDARIEEIQTSIDNADQNDRLLMLLRNLKKDVLQLRKHIVPTREAVYKLERLETALILENTDKYLRDLYDHTKQLEDTIETYNDTINNFREDYMSHLTLKTNKVIQILTIISSIFIPLTFIVGVYGMNFEFMPGLHWKYGFLSSILLMIFVSFIMVIVYVRNRWL